MNVCIALITCTVQLLCWLLQSDPLVSEPTCFSSYLSILVMPRAAVNGLCCIASTLWSPIAACAPMNSS